MKNISYFVLTALLFCSCSNNQTDVNSSINENQDLEIDSGLVNQENDEVTISVATEPMDGGFYFPDEDEIVIGENVKTIHFVPLVGGDYYGDSSTVHEDFFAVFMNDFYLYPDAFENFNGDIKIWYDAKQTKLTAEFGYSHQNVDGSAKVYDSKGKLVVDRVYDIGNIIETKKDLYAIDWTFIPESADLNIQNFDDYESINEDNHRSINLGPSMHESTGRFKNEFSAMTDKPVFENLFKVNGEPYTGELTGYFLPFSPDMSVNSKQFVMNFLDGKLHGDVEIYDWMMGLMLHEIFTNGELTETVFVIDESEMDGVAKPVVYIYPEEPTNINVQLNFNGNLAHTYPKYLEGGWNVLAKPDGTLFDEKGIEYYALFWEGQNRKDFTYRNGFVVKGEETTEFLENALEVLGLNRREANEFIMYWLPQMENNAYNLIHFSTDEYEQMAELKVNPKPETVIRVMMVWSPLETPVEIPQQNLYDLKKERQGFTVLEWGGKKQIYRQPI